MNKFIDAPKEFYDTLLFIEEANTVSLLEEVEDYINALTPHLLGADYLADQALQKKCRLLMEEETRSEREERKGSMVYPIVIAAGIIFWSIIFKAFII